MYLFFAVILGILFSIYIKSYWIISIILILISIFILINKVDKKFLIFPLIIFLVFLNFSFRDYKLKDFSGEVIGKVVYAKENKSILRTDTINGKKYRTKILFYEKLDRGANYKIKGNYNSPLPAMNYGNFDFEKNYKSQGIYSLGKIESIKKVYDANSFYRFSNFFIDRSKNIYDKNLNKRNSNLLKGVVLADKSFLEDEDIENFDTLGINHILAVSGLHIGVLAVFLNFIFLKITKNKKLTDIFVMAIILFYIVSIGLPISAIRAFLFYILYKANFYMRIDFTPKKVFFASLGIILFINPMAIYSISLIMSYTAIFGIIFIFPALISKLSSKSIFTKSIVCTASVLISLFLILNYYFYGVSILVFIANLLIVPIYFVIISFGFVMGFGIFPSAGKFLNILMDATYGIESIFSSRGSIFLSLKFFKLEYVFIYYLVLIAILNRNKLKEIIRPNLKVIEIYLIFVFFVAVLGVLKDYNTYNERHIYVDQGDCTIISIRGKNYLVDTGGARFENKIAEKYLFSALNNAGISRIDGVFISHFDEDHCGNLSKLLKNYEIDNIFINHLPKDREILRDASKFSKIIMLEKGDKVKICEDTYAEILSDNENRNNENDNSMVVLLSHKGFKTLYTGDISKDIEEKINTRVDLLKVSHHGSKTSTSEKFLENTSPRYAVISAGAHNSYGHPHKETLDKLKKHDIIYYVTSRDGEIDFKIYKSKLNVKKKLEKEDYKFYFCLVVLNTILLYMVARENYELQKDLQR